MVVSLVYLSLVHLHRLYFDYGSYTLDITGPLMVITQKVTLLTFSIHDGIARNENELTKSQKFHAIRTLPTALEYFSYMLHFQGLMAGPLVFYKDYIEFIEGKNFLKHANGNVSILISYFLHINNSYVSLSIYYSGFARHIIFVLVLFLSFFPVFFCIVFAIMRYLNFIFAFFCCLQSTLDKSGNKIVMEPSPTKAVVKKVVGSAICAYIFMNWVSAYPIKRLSGM